MQPGKFFLFAFVFSLMAGLFVLATHQELMAVAEPDELAELGLPEDKGREEVATYCGACHSLKLVVQQGLSRQAWDDLMKWMVEEQGMPELDAEDRALVLNYLAKHLSIEAALKRRENRRR